MALLSAASLMMLGACATTDETGSSQVAAADEDDGERVMVTGSIIPRKARPGEVKTLNPDDVRGAVGTKTQSSAGPAGGGL